MLQAAKYGFLGIPFAAMALSGTVMSGVGIKEQSDFKKDIEGEIGQVVIRGQIMSVDERPIRGERTILSILPENLTSNYWE